MTTEPRTDPGFAHTSHRRTSLTVPLIAGFSVMLLLMLAVTAIGVTHMRALGKQLTAIVAERNQKAELAGAMHALHEARYQSLSLASSLTDPFARDEEIQHFSHMALRFIQLRDGFLALPLDAAELALWQNVRLELPAVETAAERVISNLQQDRLGEARRHIREELAPRQERMMQAWSQLLEMQRARNRQAVIEADAARQHAQRLAMTLSAAALLVGIAIAVFVVRSSRRMENDLFDEKERARITLQSIGDAVIRFDRQRHTSYVNPVAETLLGMSAHEASGRPVGDILHLQDKQTRNEITSSLVNDVLDGTLHTLPPYTILVAVQGMEYEVEGRCAPIHTPEGAVIGGVAVLRDVTETRSYQRNLIWQAEHDSLTGLINRGAFEKKLGRILRSKRTSELPFSLLFIDLDRFQRINDSAGHAAGDELLRQIAQIMQSRIRDTDILGRLGGDEFGILLASCPPDRAKPLADAIRDSVTHYHFQWRGQEYRIGASIGIVHIPPSWETLDECLAAADAACHQAKENGRNAVVVHGAGSSA